MTACPICGTSYFALVLKRERLPILQNVVYDTERDALSAPSAPFSLSTCIRCGSSFNSEFNEKMVAYDARYNNDVVSRVFSEYQHTLAQLIISRFDIHDGYVFDVGCGSGEFLRILCDMSRGIRGIGIDPRCVPVSDQNFTLIRDEFRREYFDKRPIRLVLLRHLLGQIHNPIDFLLNLRAVIGQAPLFVEVSDLDWIFDRQTFCDFCYEECNYFTLGTLRSALSLASFEVLDQQRCFGDQYQWSMCRAAEGPLSISDAGSNVDRALAYARTEVFRIREIECVARSKKGIVLWGMSTKGVVLSNLLSRELIRGGVDMNEAKQERYAPVSGLKIHAPEWLRSPDAGSTVLVMNPNYRIEVANIIRTAGVEKELMCL